MHKVGDTLGKMFTKIKKTEKTTSGREEKAGEAEPSHPEKIYLKAMPLRNLEDIDMIKQEIESGNVLILKVSPLARKSIEDVKLAVNQLIEFAQLVGGDIARLGEERVVITPSFIRIWREKTAVSSGALPTAA